MDTKTRQASAPMHHPTSIALRELTGLVGREEPLNSVHAAILRAARDIRPVVESGSVLAACSDEFNGEIRAAFDRDVARMLTAPSVPGTRRVFAVSNMGGRIEPGAITLADQHFTARSASEGSKLLLIEIAGHVGRRETAEGIVWGELDRFGTTSPCCGALRMLLDAPTSAQAVRFPWFDQLSAFFGPERLGALRNDASPWRMARAAIVHAVLQAESAIVDLLRDPPRTPTHVLLVAMVVVNRKGTDNAVPVGVHLLRFENAMAHLEHGQSLRSTPAALEFDATRSALRVRAIEDPVHPVEPAHAAHGHEGPTLHVGHGSTQLEQAHVAAAAHLPPPSPEARAQIERSRKQLAALRGHPHAARVYARPLLRAFLQSLSVVAPELGLAALALESGRDVLKAASLKKLLERGPAGANARAVLHDFEPALQQLGHAEARQVLEYLLAEHHPILGRRT